MPLLSGFHGFNQKIYCSSLLLMHHPLSFREYSFVFSFLKFISDVSWGGLFGGFTHLLKSVNVCILPTEDVFSHYCFENHFSHMSFSSPSRTLLIQMLNFCYFPTSPWDDIHFCAVYFLSTVHIGLFVLFYLWVHLFFPLWY